MSRSSMTPRATPPFLKGLPVAPVRIIATQRELIAAAGRTGLHHRASPPCPWSSATPPSSICSGLRGASTAGAGGDPPRPGGRLPPGEGVFALDRSPAERRELEPRWRLAAGLAGLCHDVGKPSRICRYPTARDSTTWRISLLGSLTDWARGHERGELFLPLARAPPRPPRDLRPAAVDRLTPEVTAWLVDANPEIMQGLHLRPGSTACGARKPGDRRGPGIRQAGPPRRTTSTPATTSWACRWTATCWTRCATSRGADAGGSMSPARGCGWSPRACTASRPAGAEDVVSLLAADKVPGVPARSGHPGRHPAGAGTRDPAAGRWPPPPLLASGARSTRTRR